VIIQGIRAGHSMVVY